MALPVPRAAQQAIGDLIKDFAVPDSPVRWVREEGLHLTLKFFGEVEETRVSEISTALGRTTAGMSPLAVTANEVNGFPALERARVFWIGPRRSTRARTARPSSGAGMRGAGISRRGESLSSPHYPWPGQGRSRSRPLFPQATRRNSALQFPSCSTRWFCLPAGLDREARFTLRWRTFPCPS